MSSIETQGVVTKRHRAATDSQFGRLLRVDKFFWFVFAMNNYCNLHCEHCGSFDNIPIRPDSPYPHRREKWDLEPDTVQLFCERFDGIGYNDYHRLTGGEPTVMPVDEFAKIIEIFRSNNRPTWMITNGYNLMGIDKEVLNKISVISLDDHGINYAHLLRCVRFLKGFYDGKITRVPVRHHYDFYYAMKHPDNIGPCVDFMKVPSLVKGVIYPCCAFANIEKHDKNTKITEALIESGWTLCNENIVYTMKHWRDTIPDYVHDQCRNNCWRPNFRLGEKVEITLKPNDVVSKQPMSLSDKICFRLFRRVW